MFRKEWGFDSLHGHQAKLEQTSTPLPRYAWDWPGCRAARLLGARALHVTMREQIEMCHQLREVEDADKFALSVAENVAGTALGWPRFTAKTRLANVSLRAEKSGMLCKNAATMGHDDRARAPAHSSATAPPSAQRGSG